MYLYLYAPYLKLKKYAHDLALLEGRVTDFGISGKIAQLSQFLKFSTAVKEFGIKRLTTLVMVGDDNFLEEAINQCANTPTVLGFIPMTRTSVYAASLGIPLHLAAADTLAARRIARLDLGNVENRFFLGKLISIGSGIEVHTPTFSMFPRQYAKIEIINLDEINYPDDGNLTVRITPRQGGFLQTQWGAPTQLSIPSCRLKSVRPMPVTLGTGNILKTPLQVDIYPKAIRMIVGRRTVGRK